MSSNRSKKTIVGSIDPRVLSFTTGSDPIYDLQLVNADCVGTAAHVVMLSRIKVSNGILSPAEAVKVIKVLKSVMKLHAAGKFTISDVDQDVHLAIERIVTERLGDVGRRIHTCRSRNDQVALDLRLLGKDRMLLVMEEAVDLVHALLEFASEHLNVPMVGRTHMQPAMPSSVGLWASSFAESILDDLEMGRAAYKVNNKSPLGAAAGYGVPLKVDRALVSRLLAFDRPVHNVLHAVGARGKVESMLTAACSQLMLTLSRLAWDLMIYSMPEFGYFELPSEYCTGSSIMPQKKNPDVLELVRAKAAKVRKYEESIYEIMRSMPSGYNRDVQETKEPFILSLVVTRDCLNIVAMLLKRIRVNVHALDRGFAPSVFATDAALDLVSRGVPFRKAYDMVKNGRDLTEAKDPVKVLLSKKHEGAPGGLNLAGYSAEAVKTSKFINAERTKFYGALSNLMGEKIRSL